MADAKNSPGFLRKVVRFVANPATDWADLNKSGEEVRETEYAKSELKAMIERKRRNDFVRKREFDMLRKVRREGLTGDQVAALGGLSRLDDSEGNLRENGAKPDADVKAKINEIEQQMVGDNFVASTRRPTQFYEAATQPAALQTGPGGLGSSRSPAANAPAPAPRAPSGMPLTNSGRVPFAETPNVPAAGTASGARATPAAANAAAPKPLPTGGLRLEGTGSDFGNAFAVEVSEVAHDPELDEAVIAFANADFEACEQALVALTAAGGSRAQHAETWLVLFDLYRAIGEQHKFESLAIDYAQQFGWSAPQWFSMPRLVAEAAAEEPAPRQRPRIDSQVGWACPDTVDAEAVAKLRSQTLQMPLPWVLDWSHVQRIDAEACARLTELFRHWAGETIEMKWIGGDQLLRVLADAAPTGVRDVDPAVWLVRLEALRLTNRANEFDEVAIDYCVTYEVSPPSWERGKCQVRLAGTGPSTTSPPMSMVGDASTMFVESTLNDEPGSVQLSTIELSGQLVGDIAATLKQMDSQLGTAAVVNVSCAKLIRVDFIAAGDLLNWVLQRRGENRTVSFSEAQRLVALFFGAMGINEHAKVKVRLV